MKDHMQGLVIKIMQSVDLHHSLLTKRLTEIDI